MRPLAAATDSTFYEIEWELAGATVKLSWAVQVNGEVAAKLETDRERAGRIARPVDRNIKTKRGWNVRVERAQSATFSYLDRWKACIGTSKSLYHVPRSAHPADAAEGRAELFGPGGM